MASWYLYHTVLANPRAWMAVSEAIIAARASVIEAEGGRLYGVWRSQIGRPRDELGVITVWPDAGHGVQSMSRLLDQQSDVASLCVRTMIPTLRPGTDTPPTRQGNYAFRLFETPAENWDEFLSLCKDAWPGFESAYDSQVIGLWRMTGGDPGVMESLLLTRRPDLAMWERSKIPQGVAETEVRRKLSRRYDLCTSTVVFTTTLLSAIDAEDTTRWT